MRQVLPVGLLSAGWKMAEHGWLPATSGNLSARLDARHAVVTVSGIDKSSLTPEHFLTVALDQPLPPRASAEAALHLILYRRDSAIGAVLHVHSRSATLISRVFEAEGRVLLQGWELQKAFAGEASHLPALSVPVVPNDQDMLRLGDAVGAALDRTPSPGAPGFLIAGHGLYGWGRDPTEALRHLEAFDFLFSSVLALRGIPT